MGKTKEQKRKEIIALADIQIKKKHLVRSYLRGEIHNTTLLENEIKLSLPLNNLNHDNNNR